MFKGVVFDLDGTLLNTLQDLSESVNCVLMANGYPQHECEVYKEKIGNGLRNLIEVSLPENARDDEKVSNAFKVFLETYDRNYMNKTAPYERITDILRILSEKGIKIGVNSNKRTDYTNNLIGKFFPHISFSGVFGEREGIPKKPNPISALEIAEIMELDPKEIIYIGDSGTDIQTGKNAGMSTGGVLWGFRDKEEFIENGADYIFKDPEEIIILF